MNTHLKVLNQALKIFIFSTILCCSANAEKNENKRGIVRRMIGGKDVEIKDYPFMIALFLEVNDIDVEDEETFLASYSLITTKTALGAAHPIANKEPDEIYGSIGDKDKFLGQKVYFKELIPHPYYKGALFLYDIALLILDSAVSLSSGSLPPHVQTIALPRTNKEYYSGMATMVGWGIIGADRKNTTCYLKAASVSIVNACDTIYKDNPLYECRSVVLTQQADVSMMPGDSGGPLVYEKDDGKQVQIGVLSTGEMIPDGVNVYVSTSFFLDFIKEYCEGDITFV
ncbi:trypsin 3A1-like [Centruroides sculpturatus]|uniref:trypsin 3A1-like n=1 Tax=Centruroides sculpturatus TaxID=218467 RepID=UPI000C6DFF06|nr:trypsin 3A1-like [Centruroides sculpturatus]